MMSSHGVPLRREEIEAQPEPLRGEGQTPDSFVAEATSIEVEGLTVSYGSRPALRNVSLCVPARKITAVIGPSGCGKSSLLRALNRLSDLTPQCRISGRVRIGGLDVYDPRTDVRDLRRRVGMIFQKPNPFPLSVRRNIELPLREHGPWHRDELAGRIESALQGVGLWTELRDRLDTPALALSGGQQQRLCIARALALEPEVILLDEPCSALDPISSATVEDLIAGFAGCCTVVVVTHNLAQARRISQEVAFFWMEGGAGALVESGPTDRVFRRPHEELTLAYLEGVRG